MQPLSFHSIKDNSISYGENGNFTLRKNERFLYVNGKRARKFKDPYKWANPSRSVYIIGNFMIKIDTSRYGQMNPQCKKEVEKWLAMDEEDRKYFPYVFDWGVLDGRHWIVVEFVEMKEPSDYSEIIEYLCEKYKLNDLINDKREKIMYGLMDLDCAVNWAIRKDTQEPIVYDFAY